MNSNFIPILKYVHNILKHKCFVFIAGRKIGCPLWKLITHDLSKFLPSELPFYANSFYGNQPNNDFWAECWMFAWLKHQNRNDHHWEWWIPRTGTARYDIKYKDNEPVRMSLIAQQEMMSDWLGASRSYSGVWPKNLDNWKWYQKNKKNIRLHPTTQLFVENTLKIFLENLNGRK